jgi:hypothetical protein
MTNSTIPFHPVTGTTREREMARINRMADKLDDLYDTVDCDDEAHADYYEYRDEVFEHLDRIAATYGPDFATDLALAISFPWEA